ncbi:S-adenosyl-L-methionine-dependent methyltransferase [Sistotremastrum niveocremeum HHB9708]|uniref:S-adenosyl-L-methionine-dependent methyltransferase n=1 Tax=Sistotremastrum niveocremeum HHB9708 TaxID=1314777 RepID=A0A164VA38_9AGAM|nr:S-adenosyl-L-methionine-dependent methyltransferase [Sistotremastrum niveocremeum HHB9708]
MASTAFKNLAKKVSLQELKWLRDSAPNQQALHNMLVRRVAGEPLQYILGNTPFGPLTIKTRPPTLIPRPETEDWTYKLARFVSQTFPSKQLNILDLCTGTGCIPLLLSALLPPGSVRSLGIDISELACQLALENAAEAGFSHPVFRVQQNDILSPDFSKTLQEQTFDVITCNPPYIPPSEYHSLPACVKDYEDRDALLADSPDGLLFYRALPSIFKALLRAPDGVFAVEVGHKQGEAVAKLFKDARSFHSIELWNDPWDIPRTVIGRT